MSLILNHTTEVFIVSMLGALVICGIFFYMGKRAGRADQHDARFVVSAPRIALRFMWIFLVGCLLMPIPFYFVMIHFLAYSDPGTVMLLVLLLYASTALAGYPMYMFMRWHIFVGSTSIVVVPHIGRAREVLFQNLRAQNTTLPRGQGQGITLLSGGKQAAFITANHVGYDLLTEELKRRNIM